MGFLLRNSKYVNVAFKLPNYKSVEKPLERESYDEQSENFRKRSFIEFGKP